MRRLIYLSMLLLLGMSGSPAHPTLPDKINLPDDFTIDYFATDIPDARSLALGAKGTVFVGNRKQDKVYALVDSDGDGHADQRHIIADGLDMPNGVAFLNGDLFVAEHRRVLRLENIEQHLEQPPAPKVIVADMPAERHHGWRYLAAGPDGWLYLSIGAPCNICDEGLPYAAIHRFRPDGGSMQVYTEGVRNSIGITWHPETNAMWFTDNGRDWMGDDLPPDEVNRTTEKGEHFGYPYRHGHAVVDPDFGRLAPERQFTPPVLELGAHVAALGLRFYTGDMFPKQYRNHLFIAEHGSWNRTVPDGYRIIMATVKDGKVTSHQVFAEGWLSQGVTWGRPVDLLVMPDGALLISDDLRGVVYRITYHDPLQTDTKRTLNGSSPVRHRETSSRRNRPAVKTWQDW